MTALYRNTKLYRLPDSDTNAILHKGLIAAELIFVLFLDVDIQPELLQMLDKISLALKLDKAKVEYLIVNSNGISLNDLQAKYNAKHVVVFGAEPKALNINAELSNYRVYPFNQFKLLLVNDALDIYSNKQLKASLWNSLQEMFK
tara:strand:+ start:162 stop:596 length:435 start_codon:yes stop_codon:yes gene_type:complete